jgi:hypothetical protein
MSVVYLLVVSGFAYHGGGFRRKSRRWNADPNRLFCRRAEPDAGTSTTPEKLELSWALSAGIVYGMKDVGMADPFPPRVPVSADVAERAAKAVSEYPECFWFRHAEARIRYVDDVMLVIEHLRDYGDKRAWMVAKDLRRCL